MLCQFCGQPNDDEREQCAGCGQKLLIVSGDYSDVDQEAFESVDDGEQLSFDEHLLERISLLEEVMRRTATTVRRSLEALYKLEQKILVNETGVSTLRDLLERKQVLERSEWSELWERRMDRRLLALEKRERFAAVKEHIAGLYAGPERRRFEEALDDADERLLALDVDGAVERLEDALALDEQNYELAFFLGETAFNEGRVERALDFFLRVLAVRVDHYESLVYGGVLCHESGRDDTALELLGRAVVLYSRDFLPAFALGAVHAAAGRAEQATKLLMRAIAADDQVPQAHLLLGGCRLESGRVGAAITALEHAVALDRGAEEAHQVLGLAYLERGWRRKALDAFRRAQRLRPARLEYRELLSLLGDESPAAAVVPAALERVRAAEQALDEGRTERAFTLYRQALGDQPDEPTLLVAYAGICLELDRLPEIEPVVRRVLRAAPGGRLESAAWAARLEALRAAGELQAVEQAAADLLEHAVDDRQRAVGWLELAYARAERRDDLDAALEVAERAVGVAPAELQPSALAACGWVRFERGEIDAAVDALERSRRLGASARTLMHLGMALLGAGRLDDAREALHDARRAHGSAGGLRVRVLQTLQGGARHLAGGRDET
ncbi:MAG: tetratricopeptide repeat protein [Acidobacteriota bacterium]